MRRANAFPALVVQSVIALALGASATVLVQLAGKTATTIVLGLLLALFFFALLTPLRAGAMWRWCGPGGRFGFRRRGSGPRDGGGRGGSRWGGVREPRRPRWPGFPPREAGAEPEGVERTV